MAPKKNINIGYFSIEDHELLIYRLWTIAVIFFLPLYGIILQYVDPTAIDYISHRLFISAAHVLLLLLSFTSKFVKKYFAFFSLISNYTWVSWIIWIVYVNHFTPNYSIGLFLTLTLTCIIFRNQKEMVVFYTVTSILTLIAINECDDRAMDQSILCLSLFVAFVVYVIAFIHRSHTNKHLSALNQELFTLNKELVALNSNLEKKVANRTSTIQEKTLKLTAKNEELQRFTSIVSHDLKAPLRTISAFANILDKETSTLENPKIKECTQFLNGSVNRMVSIIDDLLEYSRLGQKGLLFKAANPEKMLFIVLRSIATDRSDVQVNIGENLPPQIICNTRQIEQLLQNLIDNGIKYNRNPIKKVSIDCQDTPKEWVFTVQDNGIGISVAHKEKVFDMFQRLHNSEEFKGTGIGLAICKRIVENHQGTISFQSDKDIGTTFVFSISKNLPTKNSISKKAPKKEAVLTKINAL